MMDIYRLIHNYLYHVSDVNAVSLVLIVQRKVLFVILDHM